MRITKKEIRQMVPEEDYERGLAYYEQDRVISYREEVTKDLAKLTCKVRGTKLYTVNASFSDRGLSALCTCPRFADRHCCKHLVAALCPVSRGVAGRVVCGQPAISAGP